MNSGNQDAVADKIASFREFVTNRDKEMRADMMAQYESVVVDINARFEVLYDQLKRKFEALTKRLDAVTQRATDGEARQ
jgi:hypothetical protein